MCLLCICVGLLNSSCETVEKASHSNTSGFSAHSSHSNHFDQPTLLLHAFSNPLVFHNPENFSLDVFVENLGNRPVTIFPSLFQMELRPLERGIASYHPTIERQDRSPWEGAFVLKPQEVRKVKGLGLNGKEGSWTIENGSYGISIRYFVEEAQFLDSTPFQEDSPFNDSQIWVGDLQSKEMTIRYVSKG